ncbi:anaphase promoting complex protein [Pelomyxa schiedti]|nr:anaphase promoting complex protein [Pelomyxa schiedti]
MLSAHDGCVSFLGVDAYSETSSSAATSSAPPGAGDRFVPTLLRSSSSELEAAHREVLAAEAEAEAAMRRLTLTGPDDDLVRPPPGDDATGAQGSTAKRAYIRAVEAALCNNTTKKVLSFSPAKPTKGINMPVSTLGSSSRTSSFSKNPRSVPQAPERVLDAPGLQDNYYLNVLDWGTHYLAIGLSCFVYLWSPTIAEAVQLLQTSEDNCISAVKWAGSSSFLAVATNSGDIQIWTAKQDSFKQLRTIRGHTSCVCSLSWAGNLLASGAKDGTIMISDVSRRPHEVAILRHHTDQVCGLIWSPSQTQLASGGNDSCVAVWEPHRCATAPMVVLTLHTAAVKALSWCPWEPNILATGGGYADKCIRIWNTSTGSCLQCITTNSQVTSIMWSVEYQELISSHGAPDCQLSLWKYPTMEKVGDILGHDDRILHTTRSPDGSIVVSASTDETIRFWSVWPPQKPHKTINKSNTTRLRSRSASGFSSRGLR